MPAEVKRKTFSACQGIGIYAFRCLKPEAF